MTSFHVKSSFFLLTRLAAISMGLLALASLARAQTNLPSGTVGQAYTDQISTTPAAQAGTVYGATNLPTGLSIGSTTGLISGTPTTAGTASGVISLIAGGVTNNFTYQLTINPASGTPVITSSTTASATVGVAFTYTASASNSPTSFSFSGLPAGLSGSAGGGISGTPTTSGTYSVSVSANNGSGSGAAVTLTLTVNPSGPVPAITSATSASGSAGTAFTYTITASNSPTAFSAVGLPLGLSLATTTGIISGTPSITGISSVSLSASNGSGTGATTTLTLTIGNFSTITSATTINATVGVSPSYTLVADNSPTSFNLSGLPSGLSFNTTTGVISGTPASAGNFNLTASANNNLGTGPTTNLTLTIAAGSGGGGGGGGGGGTVVRGPTFTLQPLPQTVNAGTNVTFTASASGTGTITYQWELNGSAISGATSTSLTGNASLTLTNVQTSAGGAYSVDATDSTGTTSSASAVLTVNAVQPPPPPTVTFTTQPASQTVTAGTSVTFTASANSSGALTYQWYKNGVAIAGATSATYTIANPQSSDSGTYTVVATSGSTSVTSTGGNLTVTTPVAPAPAATLENVSIRGFAGLNSQTLTIGLTVGGTGTKTALIRAVGPTLATFGVSGVLPNPTLTLFNTTTSIATNTVWGGTQALTAAFAQTGAFSLPSNSVDSALLVPLAAGPYTTQVSSATNATGVILLEAYDADTAPSPSARFINMSARGFSGTGSDVLTIGFSIGGSTTKTLLIRGIGPTLAQFGVGGVLTATQLSLYNSSGVVATNSGWGGTTALAQAFAQVSAFALPANSLDSALLVTLPPGLYTATVSGTNSTSGVALIEMYEIQ